MKMINLWVDGGLSNGVPCMHPLIGLGRLFDLRPTGLVELTGLPMTMHGPYLID